MSGIRVHVNVISVSRPVVIGQFYQVAALLYFRYGKKVLLLIPNRFLTVTSPHSTAILHNCDEVVFSYYKVLVI
jgi:hypothetical protein